jgi:hypothetical protein
MTMPGTLDRQHAFHLPALATVGTAVTLPAMLMLAYILMRNEGDFAYALAAPYTHLALGDQIAHGHYGLNPDEPSSPSSSILWPFLLAALSFLPLGPYSALLVCLAANVATALITYALAVECGVRLDRLRLPYLAAITLTLGVALNLVGLAFAGLEHSLHVTLTLASLLGLVRFMRRGKVDAWWLVSIVMLPLIRFEAAAALAADILVLVAFRKYLHALGVALAGAAIIGGFGLYLHSLGLPWLPNSVLARSAVASTGLEIGDSGPVALLRAIWSNFRVNLLAYGATHILAMLVVLVWGAARAAPRLPVRHGRTGWVPVAAAGFFAVVAVAQLTGGSLVSFSRYEIYVLALGVGTLLVVFAAEIDAFVERMRPITCAAFCLGILVLFSGYAFRTLDTLSAAGNNHDQQYQLLRFARDFYRGPVAVDHPGRINFRNPYYVLDLSNLSSEGGREAAAGDKAGAWMDAEVRRHRIGTVLMHENDYTAEPPLSWRPVARLELRNRVVGAGSAAVLFYAVRGEDAPPILDALRRLEPTLPRGARIVFLERPAGG